LKQRPEKGRKGGTCSDGEDGEGEAWVGRERVEPRRGGVDRRLVGAEGGGEEPPQLVAGQGGGVGLNVHGGRTLGYFATFLSLFFDQLQLERQAGKWRERRRGAARESVAGNGNVSCKAGTMIRKALGF
jgi:hypothetical protein